MDLDYLIEELQNGSEEVEEYIEQNKEKLLLLKVIEDVEELINQNIKWS